jgi:RNA polymerase sigma-70 factor, ECF subfamily
MFDFKDKTDEQIVEAAQKGDLEAFGEIVARYEERLIRYARSILNSSQDAQDAVQESFIKAYKFLKEYDSSRKFSPWMYRIVHNESINYGKARKSWLIFVDWDEFLPSLGGQSQDSPQERADLRSDIQKYLSKLEPKYKDVLVLYYIEDLGYSDIADILKIPVSTVGIRLKRAKDKIRKIIKKEDGGG